MKLVYPEFLFALFAISIPVIIHLFNFRKFKKIYFTNVRFLHDIQLETQSRSKLKHLLVLLARILAITFLVLAFAQPYIPINDAAIDKSDKRIDVFLDNSFSMEALNKNGNLLFEAKKRAREIASAYSANDQLRLLTNDFEARHHRFVNREEFIEMVDQVKISPTVKNLSEILSRQEDSGDDLKNTSKKSLGFVISDFQRTMSDIENIKTDSSRKIHFVPVAAQQQNNIYIDSCWLASPVKQLNQPIELYVKIRNGSNKPVENMPIKLLLNKEQKALGSFSLEGGLETIQKLTFSISRPGWQNGIITISDHPITFDDTFYFSFEVSKELPVLVINGDAESPYLNAVYKQNDYFKVTNSAESQLDYSSFSSQRLIILNALKTISSGLMQELNKFVTYGGSLVVVPHPESDLTSYNTFLQSMRINGFNASVTTETRVEQINLEHPVFRHVFEKEKIKTENVDLPLVHKYFPLSQNNRTNEEKLLKIQGGDSFLGSYAVGKGKAYVFGVSLDNTFTNFSRHALFVPVLYNIALLSDKKSQLYYTIGKNNNLELDKTPLGENVFHLKKEKFDIIPEYRLMNNRAYLVMHDQVKESGNYSATESDKEVNVFSFNYDRRESDLRCMTVDDLNEKISDQKKENINIIDTKDHDLSITVNEINQGMRLWKICIILALAFLGSEILLLRYLKG